MPFWLTTSLSFYLKSGLPTICWTLMGTNWAPLFANFFLIYMNSLKTFSLLFIKSCWVIRGYKRNKNPWFSWSSYFMVFQLQLSKSSYCVYYSDWLTRDCDFLKKIQGFLEVLCCKCHHIWMFGNFQFHKFLWDYSRNKYKTFVKLKVKLPELQWPDQKVTKQT